MKQPLDVVWRLSTFLWSWSLTITGLNHYFSSNHTHTTKNGIANRCETTNSKALGLANHKHGATITSYLLHFFLIGVWIYCALYHPQQIVQQCCAKTILLKIDMFWFFSSIFYFQGLILNIAKDVLKWIIISCLTFNYCNLHN
jgi:hypothetical protein